MLLKHLCNLTGADKISNMHINSHTKAYTNAKPQMLDNTKKHKSTWRGTLLQKVMFCICQCSTSYTQMTLTRMDVQLLFYQCYATHFLQWNSSFTTSCIVVDTEVDTRDWRIPNCVTICWNITDTPALATF